MRWLNVPNLLSLVRLLLVPFAVRAVLADDYVGALWIFAVAAVTDESMAPSRAIFTVRPE